MQEIIRLCTKIIVPTIELDCISVLLRLLVNIFRLSLITLNTYIYIKIHIQIKKQFDDLAHVLEGGETLEQLKNKYHNSNKKTL
jgi:hypothetical protein